ncbi:MAG: hypothetical protein DMF62_06890 [Acidobacteria bacterium]|nr:MAG: hypothetical protein DMF62_06890 [Acidobacteriota bacterium]
MKICPVCRKTYTDDGLNFCLDDGSVLTIQGSDAPPTMVMQNPPATNPNPGRLSTPTTPQTWGQQANYSVQPKKKSRAWLWVVGLLAVGLLLCGGGLAGFFAYVAYKADRADSNTYPSPGANTTRTNSSSTTNSTTTSGSERTKLQSIDLTGWAKSLSPDVSTEYTNGELFLGTKQKGYYYVLVSQENDFTENANTRISVRNVDDTDSNLGYGLVFHSNPQPLRQDYAFLIDAKKKRYRVVHHVPQDEPVVVRWTNSSAINDGTVANVLEVRDLNGNIDLLINDQKVTSIRNTYGFKGGVAGVYSGDAAKAAFSKLEIRK